MILNQQKVVAQLQDFIFDEVHVTGGVSGEFRATVSFIVNNENGERIDNKYLIYSGEDFNTFWGNFNSGEFLYQQLVEKEELEVTVPKDIEESFVNEIKKEVKEEEKVLEADIEETLKD